MQYLLPTQPITPYRLIALIHCMTHCAKAIRNAIYNSASGRTRSFLLAGTRFGWSVIVKAFNRDEERAERQSSAKERRLSLDAVFPDKWQNMNVELRRIIFEYKTTTELMTHLSKQLGCTEKLIVGSDGHTLIDDTYSHSADSC
jgi:hypothetical protein